MNAGDVPCNAFGVCLVVHRPAGALRQDMAVLEGAALELLAMTVQFFETSGMSGASWQAPFTLEYLHWTS
jgi:hypothetical protein